MARAGQAGLVLLWASLSVPPPGSSLQSFNISLLLLYNCSSSSYPRLHPSNTHKLGLASSTSLPLYWPFVILLPARSRSTSSCHGHATMPYAVLVPACMSPSPVEAAQTRLHLLVRGRGACALSFLDHRRPIACRNFELGTLEEGEMETDVHACADRGMVKVDGYLSEAPTYLALNTRSSYGTHSVARARETLASGQVTTQIPYEPSTPPTAQLSKTPGPMHVNHCVEPRSVPSLPHGPAPRAQSPQVSISIPVPIDSDPCTTLRTRRALRPSSRPVAFRATRRILFSGDPAMSRPSMTRIASTPHITARLAGGLSSPECRLPSLRPQCRQTSHGVASEGPRPVNDQLESPLSPCNSRSKPFRTHELLPLFYLSRAAVQTSADVPLFGSPIPSVDMLREAVHPLKSQRVQCPSLCTQETALEQELQYPFATASLRRRGLRRSVSRVVVIALERQLTNAPRVAQSWRAWSEAHGAACQLSTRKHELRSPSPQVPLALRIVNIPRRGCLPSVGGAPAASVATLLAAWLRSIRPGEDSDKHTAVVRAESSAHLNEGFWDDTRLKRASSARCIHSPLAQTAQTASPSGRDRRGDMCTSTPTSLREPRAGPVEAAGERSSMGLQRAGAVLSVRWLWAIATGGGRQPVISGITGPDRGMRGRCVHSERTRVREDLCLSPPGSCSAPEQRARAQLSMRGSSGLSTAPADGPLRRAVPLAGRRRWLRRNRRWDACSAYCLTAAARSLFQRAASSLPLASLPPMCRSPSHPYARFSARLPYMDPIPLPRAREISPSASGPRRSLHPIHACLRAPAAEFVHSALGPSWPPPHSARRQLPESTVDSERTRVKDTSPLSRRGVFLGSGMEDEEAIIDSGVAIDLCSTRSAPRPLHRSSCSLARSGSGTIGRPTTRKEERDGFVASKPLLYGYMRFRRGGRSAYRGGQVGKVEVVYRRWRAFKSKTNALRWKNYDTGANACDGWQLVV
ncbi:hypothetical protein C8Q76DRAFT_697860 [Earliella scabrosa]|nr:hypothetical protein C8Q76DRAFT_697860 [Earliella scabrosa]